jgi:NAD(P)-dependent dehydrogenase (short-subunit alcohol dehydrogenase family)
MAGSERGKLRTVLVTGASRGIGRAVAMRFASEGYAVIANDIAAQGEALAELAREIEDKAVRCEQMVGDVGDPAEVKAMAAKAIGGHGPVDVLVNNAGVLSVHRVEDLDPDEWDRMFRVNVKGTFLMTQAFLKHFRQRGAGRIINIASIGGKLSAAGQVHYCSSKAAVIRLTQGLAMELGDIGITVNAVCPGIIDTEMGRNNFLDDESLRNCKARTALGRIGKPEDVVGAVSFFASDDAAFITGQTLNVCGGIVFH